MCVSGAQSINHRERCEQRNPVRLKAAAIIIISFSFKRLANICTRTALSVPDLFSHHQVSHCLEKKNENLFQGNWPRIISKKRPCCTAVNSPSSLINIHQERKNAQDNALRVVIVMSRAVIWHKKSSRRISLLAHGNVFFGRFPHPAESVVNQQRSI